jgi:hypothetical protein
MYERVRYVQTSNQTSSNYTAYTQPIDGRITKVQWDLPAASGPAQTGSLFVSVSGTDEGILFLKNAFNAAWRKYPLVNCSDVSGTLLPGSIYTEIVCRDSVIKVVGSGMALNAGSLSGITKIFYY